MSKAKNRSTPKPAPRHPLTLSPAQIEALEEMCTLSAYTMGFSYSPAMARVCKAIAEGIELWAAERQLPRSKAIRELIFRGMAKPETAPAAPVCLVADAITAHMPEPRPMLPTCPLQQAGGYLRCSARYADIVARRPCEHRSYPARGRRRALRPP